MTSLSLTRKLLALHRRGLRRRLAGPIGLTGVLFATFILVAAAYFALNPTGPARNLSATRDLVFGLNAFFALIYAYTSFELVFRASDAHILATLPLRPESHFDLLASRVLIRHLPLSLPFISLAIAAYQHPDGPEPGAALYLLFAGLGQLWLGLSFSLLVHLEAARSLNQPSSGLKKALAGLSFPEEMAILAYAPAVALFAALVLGLVTEQWVFRAITTGSDMGLTLFALSVIVFSAFAVIRARQRAKTDLSQILPRFTEVDIPTPYREDGLPKKTRYSGLARILPSQARPYFLRDLKQNQRRYRLDRILLWAYVPTLVFRLQDLPPAIGPAPIALSTAFFFTAVLLIAPFRFEGELSAAGLDATLPYPRRAAQMGRFAASAVAPFITLLLSTLVGAAYSFTAAITILGIGLPLLTLTLLAAQWLASVGRPRVGALATLWRLTFLSLAIFSGAFS